MRDLRLQHDLRSSVQRRIDENGYEVVNRNPLRLERIGSPVAYEERNGYLVEVRR